MLATSDSTRCVRCYRAPVAPALAMVGLLAGTALAQPAPGPCQFSPYGPSCGALLSGSDTVAGGVHQVDLLVTGAYPNDPVLLWFGVPTAGVIPGTACEILAAFGASIVLVADGGGQAGLGFALPAAAPVSWSSQALPFRPGVGFRTTNGLAVDCPALPQIASITPQTAKEGDLIVIRGSGFDPNPLNHCIMIADTTAATVVSASPTRLVARVEAVPAAAGGDVGLMHGTGKSMPTGTMTLAGHVVRVRAARRFAGGHGVAAGVSFRLAPASPGATGARILSAKSIELTPASGAAPFQPLDLLFHICDPRTPPPECGDVHVGLEPTTTLTATEVARVFADYLNRFATEFSASERGGRLLVSPARGGVATAVGVLDV